ncbi:MAG: helix-turn-helix transcriptional regulator [Rhodocyclaceae bacterium]|nr:helix-turn-helix transcriptional regulator [Rhodocyclaceae bacterium]
MAESAGNDGAFGRLLRSWRRERGVSQLALALDAGVSQRHLSFVESGRARPGRAVVQRLCDALQVPLRERNQFLLAAGFAPEFPEREICAPEFAPVFDALQSMLAQQEPFPAVVVDRHWNVLLANRASERVFGAFLPENVDPSELFPDGRRNAMRFACHPRGLRPAIGNWSELAPLLFGRLAAEARANPFDRRLQALCDEIRGWLPAAAVGARSGGELPVAPLHLVLGTLEVRLFSAIASIGTPLDVTAQELRIELFFAADAASAGRVRQLSAG